MKFKSNAQRKAVMARYNKDVRSLVKKGYPKPQAQFEAANFSDSNFKIWKEKVLKMPKGVKHWSEYPTRNSQRALLDTPEKLRHNQKYWDGNSWIRKGFARDAHGVIVEDKNWKQQEVK